MKTKTYLLISLIALLLILIIGIGFLKITGKVTQKCMDGYVDLATGDENCHNLVGWGEPKSENRLMNLRQEQSLNLLVGDLDKNHKLSFKHYDGLCDDSFEVYIENKRIFPFVHYEGGNLIEKINIDASLITSDIITITFKNTASDDCGYAGVDWVKIEVID